MNLLVVDILRSSMNDGPGVRTTVFAKGCPLRCLWCHNPESQSMKPQLSFDAERCTACGECAKVCPNHRFIDGKHQIDWRHCQACGRCVQACPNGALKIVGTPYTPEQIVEIAMRDKRYFDRTGGGLTISGGEPMSQFEAVHETLRLARAAGIHTCLDTCGQAPTDDYLRIAPQVSLFLWDYKATGSGIHRNLTGVDGELILRNLRALYAAGANIRLRCPMVPGVNDAPEHLQRIADLSREMPQLDGIDLMAYHAFARDKALKVGMAPGDMPEATTGDEQVEKWMQQLRDLGCDRVTLG